MSPTALTAGAPDHVEAYCATGTSPGGAACTTVSVTLDDGRALETTVRYEVIGPSDAPTIAVLGGISADRHLAPTAVNDAPGWWPGLVGPGCALDPTRLRLVGIDWTTLGPQEAPNDAGPAALTTHDQARLLAGVLDRLAVERVSLVGASYGGMVALAFAALFPGRVRRLAALCAAHRTHPMATALRALQRRFVGFAAEVGRPEVGLSLGRALAMTTYRSAEEFDVRFDWRAVADPTSARFPVEAYLDARGGAFATRFTPQRFTRLSESIDLHAVEPSHVTPPTVLVSVRSDALVPPWLVDELAAGAPGVEAHVTLDSVYGHDAFLKETSQVSGVVRDLVAREVAA